MNDATHRKSAGRVTIIASMLLGLSGSLSSCDTPTGDGLTFVGKNNHGRLVIGFITCNQPDSGMDIYRSPSSKDDQTSTETVMGSWTLKRESRFAILDPLTPGPEWKTKKRLHLLTPNLTYTTFAASKGFYAGQQDFTLVNVEKLPKNSYLASALGKGDGPVSLEAIKKNACATTNAT